MQIDVGAFDPNETVCNVQVRLYEQVNGYGQNTDVSVWVDNVDSRSKLYGMAKEEALRQLKRAVAALEADLETK